jgi:hypothetical protein
MRRGQWWCGLVVMVCASPSLRAMAPAFIEATSERDDGKPASSMWNAVDGNQGTIWCSQRSPAGKEALNFTFKEPVIVTHLELVLPAKDGVTDTEHKRPRVVYVADAQHRVEARFKDVASEQRLELTPPATGTRVVIEFEDSWPARDADAPLCVAEVGLIVKGKRLTDGLGAKVRSLNTPARRLLHQWHDDVSAPSRTLTFDVDGTFTYRFEDLLGEQKPVALRGRWSATAGALTLETGGKTYRLQTRLTAIESAGRSTTLLTIAGSAPDPSLAADFTPAPLLLP